MDGGEARSPGWKRERQRQIYQTEDMDVGVLVGDAMVVFVG
jgi:hypothetical protein